MVGDSVADLIARIKNAIARKYKAVSFPHSKLVEEIVKVLYHEGFLSDYEIKELESPPFKEMSIKIAYLPNGEAVIRGAKKVSKSGVRVYIGYRKLQRVMNGYGIAIVSTSKGIMTDKEAKKQKVGGEVLCEVW